MAIAESFYREISSPASHPVAPQRYRQECLARYRHELEPPSRAYCLAREGAGHDAVASELASFHQRFERIARRCEREALDRFHQRLGEGWIPCREIESWLRDSLAAVAATQTPAQLACLEAQIPDATSSLREQCGGDGLPAPEAQEALQGLAGDCPARR